MANEKVGGLKEIEILFLIEEIIADFPNYEIIILEEKQIELNKGVYHIWSKFDNKICWEKSNLML